MSKFMIASSDGNVVLVNLDNMLWANQEGANTRIIFGKACIDIDGGIEDFIESVMETEFESGTEADE